MAYLNSRIANRKISMRDDHHERVSGDKLGVSINKFWEINMSKNSLLKLSVITLGSLFISHGAMAVEGTIDKDGYTCTLEGGGTCYDHNSPHTPGATLCDCFDSASGMCSLGSVSGTITKDVKMSKYIKTKKTDISIASGIEPILVAKCPVGTNKTRIGTCLIFNEAAFFKATAVTLRIR